MCDSTWNCHYMFRVSNVLKNSIWKKKCDKSKYHKIVRRYPRFIMKCITEEISFVIVVHKNKGKKVQD